MHTLHTFYVPFAFQGAHYYYFTIQKQLTHDKHCSTTVVFIFAWFIGCHFAICGCFVQVYAVKQNRFFSLLK